MILLQMRLVLYAVGQSAPIIPNMANLFVQKFHRNKPAPQMLDRSLCDSIAIPKTDMGRTMLMRSDQRPSTLVMTGNYVSTSLDPRLQGRLPYSTTPNISNMTSLALSDGLADSNATSSAMASDQNTTRGLEDRLQELEDEVMKLKTDNMLKDREIRRLTTENEQQRGIGYDTGMKRPRV